MHDNGYCTQRLTSKTRYLWFLVALCGFSSVNCTYYHAYYSSDQRVSLTLLAGCVAGVLAATFLYCATRSKAPSDEEIVRGCQLALKDAEAYWYSVCETHRSLLENYKKCKAKNCPWQEQLSFVPSGKDFEGTLKALRVAQETLEQHKTSLEEAKIKLEEIMKKSKTQDKAQGLLAKLEPWQAEQYRNPNDVTSIYSGKKERQFVIADFNSMCHTLREWKSYFLLQNLMNELSDKYDSLFIMSEQEEYFVGSCINLAGILTPNSLYPLRYFVTEVDNDLKKIKNHVTAMNALVSNAGDAVNGCKAIERILRQALGIQRSQQYNDELKQYIDLQEKEGQSQETSRHNRALEAIAQTQADAALEQAQKERENEKRIGELIKKFNNFMQKNEKQLQQLDERQRELDKVKEKYNHVVAWLIENVGYVPKGPDAHS